MDSYPDLEQDEVGFYPQEILDPSNLNSQLNQLTVSTIVSLSPDIEKKLESDSGINYLYNNKEPAEKKPEITAGTQFILENEKWYFLTLQVFIPFLLAGFGTIGAGVVLGNVENYKVFKKVKALYILVPALLGLKGNLDMCLASRLSTQANLGNMKDKQDIFQMIIGNLGLVQIQSIVAACLVSIFAVGVSAAVNGGFLWAHALLLAACSVLTATVSCFILDFLLIAVIFLSRKFKLNPDNLATPFAASVGDVVSLLMLSLWANILYELPADSHWIMIVVLLVYVLILLPFWILIVRRNVYTSKILMHGWTPVLCALIISGLGGLVLDSAVGKFNGFAVFQPIINGIGGNLVSVQSSRISTMLHKTSIMGVIPPHTKQWVAPWTALFAGKTILPAQTARILILMSIPGHTAFAFIADLIFKEGVSSIRPIFLFSYLCVGLIQVLCLLYICHLIVHSMWRYKIDPDNSAIPYLTALGDLLGSALLLLAFVILRSINHEYGLDK